jgi:hypothetical protein
MEVSAVSRWNLSLYSSQQICMQCLTDLIIILVAVESIFKNPQSALMYRYFRQSLKSDYPGFEFLPPSSAKCKSVRKPHANLLDTPVALTGAPK